MTLYQTAKIICTYPENGKGKFARISYNLCPLGRKKRKGRQKNWNLQNDGRNWTYGKVLWRDRNKKQQKLTGQIKWEQETMKTYNLL